MGGTLERHAERGDTAAVDGDRDRRRIDIGCRGDLPTHGLLARVVEQPVAVAHPALGTAEREKPRVLARAVVCDPRRLGTALEVVLGRGRVGEDAANDSELLRGRPVRGAEERDLLVVEIGQRPDDGQRLERLRRRAEERDELRVASSELDLPATHRDRMDEVPGLDEVATCHLDDDRRSHRSRSRIPHERNSAA